MTNYHSSVSRRDFMKAMGLVGAGMGAATAVTPAFRDLDELTASTDLSVYKKWWIKENDFGQLTTEVDWKVFNSFDTAKHPMPVMFGPTANGAMSAKNLANRKKRQTDGMLNKWPGSTLRDLALDGATGGNYPSIPWNGPNVSTPEGRGVPRWEGTPEDNTIMCKAASHFYGAPRCGAIEVDDKVKKFFNTSVVWEDTDTAYTTSDGKQHVPNKCKWILTWLTKQNHAMNKYTLRNNPDDPWYNTVFRQGKAGENQAYSHAPQIQYQVMGFLKGLGYQAIKATASGNTQFGVWSGLCESGRTTYALSPDYGLMVRYIDFCITDLPLAPTKPINAGLSVFCKNCMTCAKVCPSNTISLEKEPSWDTKDPGNNPGLKTWYLNWTTCAEYGGPFDCVNCQTVCPFSHDNDKSAIHNIIRGTVGTTHLFDGFFANMEKFWGYNTQLSDQVHTDWWYRDLETWEHDTLLGFGTKGW
ncbi:reductive dehalogenase [Dehalococcoides mccartyi]|uniref:Reductive dehalogenase n=1 Tax=Dehalococcoides mccartyi (strain VS) TaxID=311424 RepID=D2BG22_DEHMV|nr:reductive dehalogenase [Dehalococcoides mccartyi]ACZ61272.1 reductive dehalogenase [Dehalococcoides mccartyi VS]